MTEYFVGMVGLGVMGANLARNMACSGFSVAGYDLDADKRQAFDTYANEGPLASFPDVERFINETTAHPERGVPYALFHKGAAAKP